MAVFYLDSSIALHAVLPWGDPRARDWLDATRANRADVYSSTLMNLELTRALRRERLGVSLVRPVVDRISQISIDDGVLQVAGSIESHVKSLDAIHLATAMIIGADISVVTHDGAMARVAEALGLETVDPLGCSPSNQIHVG